MLTINMAPNALKQQFVIKIELITALKALKSPCTLPFFWYIFTFIGVGGTVMLLPSILVYTNFHFVYEMSYENFVGNQAVMNHTVFPCFVQIPQMTDKDGTSNSRYTNMKFMTYFVFGHPNWIFLLFLDFVYYPCVPIVHGTRRDYS